MTSCLIYIVLILFVVLVLFCYINNVKRDSCETTSVETDIISNETKEDLDKLDKSVITKYIKDMMIQNRLATVENELSIIKQKIECNNNNVIDNKDIDTKNNENAEN